MGGSSVGAGVVAIGEGVAVGMSGVGVRLAVGVQLAVTTAVFTLMVLGLKTVGALSIGPSLTVGYVAGVAVLAKIRA